MTKEEKKTTQTVLTHHVVMEKYEVPVEVCNQGEEEVEEYILRKELEPVSSETRDWEIVDCSK